MSPFVSQMLFVVREACSGFDATTSRRPLSTDVDTGSHLDHLWTIAIDYPYFRIFSLQHFDCSCYTLGSFIYRATDITRPHQTFTSMNSITHDDPLTKKKF